MIGTGVDLPVDVFYRYKKKKPHLAISRHSLPLTTKNTIQRDPPATHARVEKDYDNLYDLSPGHKKRML
jgi:hypothetical protein